MKTTTRPALDYNLLSDTDSYKLSHWNQYPTGLRSMMSYFESRGGEFPTCTLFGLQYLLHRCLSQLPIDSLPELAFDHREILDRALSRSASSGDLPVATTSNYLH